MNEVEDAILSACAGLSPVPRLTVARLALLQKMESPYITGGEVKMSDVICANYALTQSINDVYAAIKYGYLQEKAFEWCDGLEQSQWQEICDGVSEALGEFNALAPVTSEGEA